MTFPLAPLVPLLSTPWGGPGPGMPSSAWLDFLAPRGRAQCGLIPPLGFKKILLKYSDT